MASVPFRDLINPDPTYRPISLLLIKFYEIRFCQTDVSLILIDTFACQDDVGRVLAQWRDSDTHSLLVVGGAKLLEAVAKRIDSLRFGADDHAEEILLEEARRGEGEAVLLCQKLSTELDIVLDILELFYVDAHHHVHGCAASDGSHTSDGAESAERGL